MMNKRKQRLLLIGQLIESESIASQDDLLVKLQEKGVKTTQSTLSRDLKFMKIAKLPDKEKGYVYALSETLKNGSNAKKGATAIMDSILNISFSGNMGVLHTRPGYANAVTAMIDSERYPEILGTIAGDDTIFIVLREGTDCEQLIRSLKSIHPDIHTLYH